MANGKRKTDGNRRKIMYVLLLLNSRILILIVRFGLVGWPFAHGKAKQWHIPLNVSAVLLYE